MHVDSLFYLKTSSTMMYCVHKVHGNKFGSLIKNEIFENLF